ATPRAAYFAHRDAIDAAVQRVLQSGWYLQGRETEAFEAEFAEYLGVRHAVTAGSGTDALLLGLKTLGIGPGDAVATVSHTAVATVAAIDLVGALPVLVDVDPTTYCMDPERLQAALAGDLGPRIRAIIPVHLYGHPAEILEIQRIAERHNAPVLEDCAQSHGAAVSGRKTGGFGSLGAFSFYPTKNLGALGDGGALVTDDPRLADRARCLKQYGWQERYVSRLPGLNTRLDELQAAVLRVKLPHLNADNARRRQLAALYSQELADTPLQLPRASGPVTHVFHQYVLQHHRRDALRAYLEAQQIGSAIHYPVPVHLQPGYCDRVAIGPGGLAHTERLCHRILSLPLNPTLHDEEVAYAGAAIADWLEMEHP
ncbi:MAG: DegT/DnrJ/EryC1/StrS family aminotransferase, partial [Actinomycetota bacterium]